MTTAKTELFQSAADLDQPAGPDYTTCYTLGLPRDSPHAVPPGTRSAPITRALPSARTPRQAADGRQAAFCGLPTKHARSPTRPDSRATYMQAMHYSHLLDASEAAELDTPLLELVHTGNMCFQLKMSRKRTSCQHPPHAPPRLVCHSFFNASDINTLKQKLSPESNEKGDEILSLGKFLKLLITVFLISHHRWCMTDEAPAVSWPHHRCPLPQVTSHHLDHLFQRIPVFFYFSFQYFLRYLSD